MVVLQSKLYANDIFSPLYFEQFFPETEYGAHQEKDTCEDCNRANTLQDEMDSKDCNKPSSL